VGPFADARGRFGGGRAGIAIEVDARRLGAASPRGIDLAARAELDLVAYGAGTSATVSTASASGGATSADATAGATFLAGFAASRELASGPTLFAATGIGLHLARVEPEGSQGFTTAAPAGRLALGVGFRRRGGMPFIEASVLGVAAGRTDANATLALSVGWRFDLENRRHGHPAHRR
jgi:hypothetical protein